MTFIPSDLSTCIAWWRSEDIPSGGGDPLNWDDVISAWRLQGTGTARPTYSGTAIGGLPGLVFDGTDDCMVTTTAMAVSGQLGVAMVVRRDELRVDDRLFSIHTASSNPTLTSGDILSAAMNANDSILLFWDFASGSWEYFRPVVAATTDTVISVVRGELEIGWSVNGLRSRGTSLDDSPAAPATGQPTLSGTCYFHLGKRSTNLFLKGRVSEIVVWNEPYDCRHRPWIEGYLCHKYGVTMPTAHPFYSAAPTTVPPDEGDEIMPTIPNQLQRSIGDAKAITFQWPSAGATITGTVSKDNGAYGAVAGAIVFLRTESGKHYFTLAYNAADRPTAEGVSRFKLVDGTYTKYINLIVNNLPSDPADQSAVAALIAAEAVKTATIIDGVGYVTAALIGECADGGTAAETYSITFGGSTYTLDHTDLTAAGNRGAVTRTKT